MGIGDPARAWSSRASSIKKTGVTLGNKAMSVLKAGTISVARSLRCR